MPTYLAPGIYVEEKSGGSKPIAGASTSVAAFVGMAVKGPLGQATLVSSFGEFVKRFGGPIRVIEGLQEIYLYHAVRHFFAHGGTRCYVVRAAGAAAASASAVIGPLTISAISPGDWGEGLSVAVAPTSQYSVAVAELAVAIPAGSPLLLAENTDVRIGSLLWVVNEASGIVASVAGNDVTFEIGLANGSDTAPTIQLGATAYMPDFALDTTTINAAVNVVPGVQAVVRLDSVTKADGTTLRAGDVVNFALTENVGAVTRISEAVDSGGAAAMEVVIAPVTTAPVDDDGFRVYERGFSLAVSEGGEIVEVHENLSLVAADVVNHVAVRLPAEEGRSFYVTLTGAATALAARATATLAGGDDGLPSPAAGVALDLLVIGDPVTGTGLHALDKVKDASMLCVPHVSTATAAAAVTYCEGRKDMIYVMDVPRDQTSVANAVAYAGGLTATSYAALYFPWIRITDPLTGRRISAPTCGAVAGIYARSDGKRGVHKAPAGIDVGRVDVAQGVATLLTKAHNDTLHGVRVNAIRSFPEGILVWGARTISADPEWVYVNVRRLFIFLEQSIEAGTQWVAFEPNDESLWKKITRNVSAFLKLQWLAGALVGATPEEAFYVKCDSETNPAEIVDAGQVVTEIGVAPSKPAEFVVFRIKQIAGGDTGS